MSIQETKDGNNNSGNCEEHLRKPICTLAFFKFIGGFICHFGIIRQRVCRKTRRGGG